MLIYLYINMKWESIPRAGKMEITEIFNCWRDFFLFSVVTGLLERNTLGIWGEATLLFYFFEHIMETIDKSGRQATSIFLYLLVFRLTFVTSSFIVSQNLFSFHFWETWQLLCLWGLKMWLLGDDSSGAQ